MKGSKITMLLVAILLVYGIAHAEREAEYQITANGRFLVIAHETRRVPFGASMSVFTRGRYDLDSEKAADLVEGKIDFVQVKDEKGATTNRLAFPWVKSTTQYTDKMVYFRNGDWDPQDLPVRVEQIESKSRTIFFVLLPLLSILFVSVACVVTKEKLGKLPIFYVAVLASLGAGAWDPLFGAGVGIVGGLIFALYLQNKNDAIPLAGILTGVFAGIGSWVFEGDVLRYSLLLLGAQMFSFFLAYGIGEIMGLRRVH